MELSGPGSTCRSDTTGSLSLYSRENNGPFPRLPGYWALISCPFSRAYRCFSGVLSGVGKHTLEGTVNYKSCYFSCWQSCPELRGGFECRRGDAPRTLSNKDSDRGRVSSLQGTLKGRKMVPMPFQKVFRSGSFFQINIQGAAFILVRMLVIFQHVGSFLVSSALTVSGAKAGTICLRFLNFILPLESVV